MFSSGGYHDSMVVVKQESRYAKANDRSFTQVSHFLYKKWCKYSQFIFEFDITVHAMFYMLSKTCARLSSLAYK